MCVKSELEEQRSHKAVTVSIDIDLLLVVSLQWQNSSQTTFKRFTECKKLIKKMSVLSILNSGF